MAASLVTQRGTRRCRPGCFCFFSESSCCWPSYTVFWFLFILVRSIIKNGEKGAKQCVNIWFESCSTSGEDRWKLVPRPSRTPEDAPRSGLFLGSRASRFLDSKNSIQRVTGLTVDVTVSLRIQEYQVSILHTPEYVLVRYKTELFQSWDIYTLKVCGERVTFHPAMLMQRSGFPEAPFQTPL